jgi:hypothetical protein
MEESCASGELSSFPLSWRSARPDRFWLARQYLRRPGTRPVSMPRELRAFSIAAELTIVRLPSLQIQSAAAWPCATRHAAAVRCIGMTARLGPVRASAQASMRSAHIVIGWVGHRLSHGPAELWDPTGLPTRIGGGQRCRAQTHRQAGNGVLTLECRPGAATERRC